MVAKGSRLLQIGDMASVKDIEASIGKYNGLSSCFPEIYLVFRFLPRQREVIKADRLIITSCIKDFFPFDLISSYM